MRLYLLVAILAGLAAANGQACTGTTNESECCSPEHKCGLHQGDCDHDDDCEDGLMCDDHSNNCKQFHPGAELDADCCIRKPNSGNEFLTEMDDCECGEPVAESNRLFGGEEAIPGEIPWQAGLVSYGRSVGCGGTLVSDRHVITAAHCVDEGLTARHLSVLVGETNRRSLRDIIPVKEIIIHEDFFHQRRPFIIQNDIAVLVLSQPVNLTSNPNIKPACLPRSQKITELGNKLGLTSGWGFWDHVGNQPSHLQKLTIKIRSDDWFCRNDDQFFCAANYGTEEKICGGDSGGPLVAKGDDNNGAATLFGVTSYVSGPSSAPGCFRDEAVALYANVQTYISNGWLKKRLDGGITCKSPRQSNWTP